MTKILIIGCPTLKKKTPNGTHDSPIVQYIEPGSSFYSCAIS